METFSRMSKRYYAKKQALENGKNRNFSREKKDSPVISSNTNLFSRHLKKIYPIGLHRTCSPLSLSSLSLSLSTDSSVTDSLTPLDQKIASVINLIAPHERREVVVPLEKNVQVQQGSEEETRRCNWITKNSGKSMVF